MSTFVVKRIFRPTFTMSDGFKLIFVVLRFCLVVVICDLVHDVETVFHLPYPLMAIGNIFVQYE